MTALDTDGLVKQAFAKLRAKIKRVHPSNVKPDLVLRLQLTHGDIVAILSSTTEAADLIERQAAEIARLREALGQLEAANDALCRVRSQAVYDQMMADCCAGELSDLDEARRNARQTLKETTHDR